MVKSWLDNPMLREAMGEQGVQVHLLSFLEFKVLEGLKRMITQSMRTHMDPFYHPHTLLRFGTAESMYDPLYILNRMSGYVYLVDEERRIRWRFCFILFLIFNAYVYMG